MKKTILILIIVLIIPCNAVFSEPLEQKSDSCDNDLGTDICIEITFKTSINKEYLEVSKYQKYPYYVRQFDYLYIDNFRVINQGQNKTKKIEYTLYIRPIDYLKIDSSSGIAYQDFSDQITINIPELNSGDIFEQQHLKDNYYLKKLNENLTGNLILYPTGLYKEGEWVIEEKLLKESLAHITFINGRYSLFVFQVESPLDIESFIDGKKSLNYSLWGIGATILLSILGIVVTICGGKKEKQIEKKMKTNKDSLQNKKEVITKGWFIGLEEIKSDISSYSESILTVFTFLLTSIIIKPNPDIFKQIPILRLVIIIAIVLLVYFMCKKNCLNNKLAKYFEKEEFEFFWWRNSWPIFLIISAVSFILWISTIGIWKKANIFFWFSFLVLLFYCIINFFINKKGNVDDGEEKMKKDKKFIREVSRFLELLEGNYGKNIPNQELKDKFGKDYERIIAYLTVQGGRGRLILRNSKSCKLNDASLDKIRSFISDINKHRLDEAHIITNVVLTFAIFVIALIGTLISTLEVTTSERAPTLFKISLVIIWGAFVASLLFLIKKLPK